MRKTVVGLAIAAVLAPAALADGGQGAPRGAQASATTWCRQLRTDAAAWAAFQTTTVAAQGKTFAQHFGAGRNQRNAIGRCVTFRVKALADARRATPQVPQAPEQPAASLEVAEMCKAILAGRQADPDGKSFRNIGECLKEHADDDDADGDRHRDG